MLDKKEDPSDGIKTNAEQLLQKLIFLILYPL